MQQAEVLLLIKEAFAPLQQNIVDLKNELKQEIQHLQKDVRKVKTQVQHLQKDVRKVETQVQHLQENVLQVKKDVQYLQEDVQYLQEDVQNTQKEVRILQKEVQNTNQRLGYTVEHTMRKVIQDKYGLDYSQPMLIGNILAIAAAIVPSGFDTSKTAMNARQLVKIVTVLF